MRTSNRQPLNVYSRMQAVYTEIMPMKAESVGRSKLPNDLQPSLAHHIITPDNRVEPEIKYRKTPSNLTSICIESKQLI